MILKLSLSDEVSARIDRARGLHSRQEFVTNAIIAALEGSAVERELRAEIDRLHKALRADAAPPQEFELKW